MNRSVTLGLVALLGACEPSPVGLCEGTARRCYLRPAGADCCSPESALATCDEDNGVTCPTGFATAAECGPIDPSCGEDVDLDAGPGVDAGGPVSVGPAVSLPTGAPADYGCRGRGVVLGPSTMFEASGRLVDEADALGDAMLRYHDQGDELTDPSCQSCVSLNLDMAGRVALSGIAGERFAYVYPPNASMGADLAPTIGQHLVVPPAGEPVTLLGLSNGSLGLVSGLVGGAGTDSGFLFGEVLDCTDAGEPVTHAAVRVFAEDGSPVALGTGGPTDFYFDGGAPILTRGARTGVDGRFGVAPLPADPGGTTYRIEIWGSLSDGAPSELLACESALMAPGTATLVRMAPLSERSPSGCF